MKSPRTDVPTNDTADLRECLHWMRTVEATGNRLFLTDVSTAHDRLCRAAQETMLRIECEPFDEWKALIGPMARALWAITDNVIGDRRALVNMAQEARALCDRRVEPRSVRGALRLVASMCEEMKRICALLRE